MSMAVDVFILDLGDKFIDDRQRVLGYSYQWGPIIVPAKVANFTFHHSVTKQTAKIDGDWKKEVDVIANIHVNGNKWDGIGYRFVIASSGHVLYVGDLSHGGSAVANKNDTMFSACLVGDFTKELPTAAQVHSAHLLAKHFLTEEPNYPNLNSWDDVKGHREFPPTACPGNAWKTPGDNLYTRIKDDKWQGYPDPQPSVPTPVPPVDPCTAVKQELADTKIKLDKANSDLNQARTDLANAQDKLNQIESIAGS